VFKILKGYALLSLITCIEIYIGFLILGINKAFLLALVIAVVDVLPVLGTGTVLIPWAVVSVLTENFQIGIGLTVIYIITILVRNFLEPKIIGMQVGVNSLFTLMAMFFGLKVLGISGLFLFPIILIVTIQYYKSELKEGLSV
jgi:predicted PurR-regulated permease PerM